MENDNTICCVMAMLAVLELQKQNTLIPMNKMIPMDAVVVSLCLGFSPCEEANGGLAMVKRFQNENKENLPVTCTGIYPFLGTNDYRSTPNVYRDLFTVTHAPTLFAKPWRHCFTITF